MRKVQICLPPLGPSLFTKHLPCIMDQILTHCDEVVGIADSAVVHGKDDKEHDILS